MAKLALKMPSSNVAEGSETVNPSTIISSAFRPKATSRAPWRLDDAEEWDEQPGRTDKERILDGRYTGRTIEIAAHR